MQTCEKSDLRRRAVGTGVFPYKFKVLGYRFSLVLSTLSITGMFLIAINTRRAPTNFAKYEHLYKETGFSGCITKGKGETRPKTCINM